MSDQDGDNSDIYGYQPSTSAAAVAAVVFSLLTILHGYQMFRTRTWYFIAFFVGGLLESFGYIVRCMSIQQGPDYGIPLFAIQSLFVLVAPSLFAASMYMELGRIMRLTEGEKYSIVRFAWLTKIFVIGDAIAFAVQMMGATLLATADSQSSQDRGEMITIVGLAVQVIFFGLFVAAAVMFHRRINRNPTRRIQETELPWKKHLLNVYISSTLVLIRCVIRLVEYAQGKEGYLLSNEWTLYVFDALVMVAVMVAFAVVHPSEIGALLRGNGWAIEMVVFTRKIEAVQEFHADMERSKMVPSGRWDTL